jgi:hypothetical protein
MRKLSLCLVAIAGFFACSYAQDIQFGAQAGVNFSGASAKNPNEKFKGSPLPGIEAGVFADVPLTENLSFHPQAFFSLEGYKPKIDPFTANIHVFYFKIPLDVLYHLSSGGGKLLFGLGPYVGFALSGKYKRKGGDEPDETVTIKFGNDKLMDDLKRLDMGLNLFALYKIQKNISAGAKFDLGLVNISSSGDGIVYHTRSFALFIAYAFGK